MSYSNEPLFTCALVSDTHLKPEKGEHSTPWITNQLANVRSRFVVEQINRTNPDFVVHLGDLVHPVPALPTYDSAAEVFKQIYGQLEAPLYTIPGNHDIGDKPGPWMPAALVDEESIAAYERHFGETHYGFDAGGCRCILINNPVLNSGLPEEEDQRAWLENELAEHDGRRIFLFMHYPLYLTTSDEAGHYENLDEPGRSWLLSLIEEHAVEAVFAGHTHNFFFNRYAGSDLFVLPSVTSVRQDYSELFRVEPAAEYGRNDTGKFGFFILSAYEQGYTTRFVRTAGKTVPEDGADIADRASSSQVATNPKIIPAPATVGVDLRHPWAEVTKIPYNYILDEFIRKKVRNDYPVLALWDLGIEKLRVPAGDLVDPRIRARMKALHSRGHKFTVFTFDLPPEPVRKALRQHHELVNALELILPWDRALQTAAKLQLLREHVSFPIYLSRLETSGDVSEALNKGIYYVRHGFRTHQHEMITAFLEQTKTKRAVDGLAFRIGPGTDPWEEIRTIDAMADGFGIKASVTVQLASNDTAEVVDDDWHLANRTAKAAAAAFTAGELDVFIDTFADMDRGYFVRNGLVDRRYNPRLAGQVLRHLSAALGAKAGPSFPDPTPASADGRTYSWGTSSQRFVLVTARANEQAIKHIPIPNGLPYSNSGTADCHDLATGALQTVQWHSNKSPEGTTITIERKLPGGVPQLLVIGK